MTSLTADESLRRLHPHQRKASIFFLDPNFENHAIPLNGVVHLSNNSFGHWNASVLLKSVDCAGSEPRESNDVIADLHVYCFLNSQASAPLMEAGWQQSPWQ